MIPNESNKPLVTASGGVILIDIINTIYSIWEQEAMTLTLIWVDHHYIIIQIIQALLVLALIMESEAIIQQMPRRSLVQMVVPIRVF